MDIVNIIGGRKAAACLTGLVVVVGCFLIKGAIPDQLVDAIKYLVTTYLAGNLAADVVDGLATQAQAKTNAAVAVAQVPAPIVDSDTLKVLIDAMGTRQAGFELTMTRQNETIQSMVNFLNTKFPPQQA